MRINLEINDVFSKINKSAEFKPEPVELLDEMRMVEEVVMMEREVVVGGLQSPGLR